MTFVQWVAAAVVMVTTLVVIHEFGHFLAAKLFGVGTRVFSLGIGPRVWGVRLWDTDFRIALLPIGGYVQMAGADPFGDEDHDEFVPPERDFMRKPVWQRLIIMLAGPAMNLALPLVLFTAVPMLGEPKSQSVARTVYAGSPAEAAGIHVGDRILAIDGARVDVWDELQEQLELELGHAVTLTVQAPGGPERTVQIAGEAVRRGRNGHLDLIALGFSPLARSTLIGVVDPASPAGRAGLRTGDLVEEIDDADVRTWEELEAALATGDGHAIAYRRAVEGEIVSGDVELRADPAWVAPEWAMADRWGFEYPALVVGGVEKGSAAEQNGVRPGDRLVAIDGARVDGWDDVLVLVAATARPNDKPRALKLDLAREGKLVHLEFQPTWERDLDRDQVVSYRPRMGVGQYGGIEIAIDLVPKYYPFGEAFGRAVQEVRDDFRGMLRMVWNLVSVQVPVTDALGGPVAIVREAGVAAQSGIFHYVKTMAIISLSLGVVNLLPFPVLDGGQIVFYLIEGIRGRPVSGPVRERIQMLGVLGLMALFLVVTVNDLSRWIGG